MFGYSIQKTVDVNQSINAAVNAATTNGFIWGVVVGLLLAVAIVAVLYHYSRAIKSGYLWVRSIVTFAITMVNRLRKNIARKEEVPVVTVKTSSDSDTIPSRYDVIHPDAEM